MTLSPRDVDSIYTSLRDRLKNKISGLTNFAESSFNYVWTQAFSKEFREMEINLLEAQLGAWVGYSGGPIDSGDLNKLNIDDSVDVEDIDLPDNQLDELVKIVGVERDPGAKATGTVTFTTDSAQTDIPKGTSVGTQPDAEGDFFEFETSEAVSTSNNETEVDAEVIAIEVGTGYNVGSGTVTYLPNPPGGVQSVTNDNAMTGGEDEETNDELRARAKNAIFNKSGGGTVEGIIGYVQDNVDGVVEVEIVEKFTGDSRHGNYPHGHVIVDGGPTDEVEQAIQEGRPVSVQHILIQPFSYPIRIDMTLEGTDIDTAEVRDRVNTYIEELGMGDTVTENKIIQTILNADDNIDDISSLTLFVEAEDEYWDESRIDAFEDNNITIGQDEWGDWAGDTGSFSAQNGTVISGNYSGELASSNANNSVSTTRTSTLDRDYTQEVRIDTQTGNASDVLEITFYNANTELGSLQFDGSGNIDWDNSSITNISSWSAGTTYEPVLDFDFSNDQVDITVNGTTSSTLSLENSASGFDEIEIRNDTTASASTVNTYVDNLFTTRNIFPLGKGNIMPDDAVTKITGTSGGNSVTFTEGTDFEEIDNSGDNVDDAVEWFYSGDVPDPKVGETQTFTFDKSKEIYRIGDDLAEYGIVKVEGTLGGNSHTFVDGTDYNELDNDGDGAHDSIDWGFAGDKPDDGTDFTVTYDAGTLFEVTYEIENRTDIVLSKDERPVKGSINITIA